MNVPEITRRNLLAVTMGAGALAVAGSVVAGAEAATAAPAKTVPATSGPLRTQTATVYLVRHGQTWLNLEGLAQGWSDAPLTTTWAPTAQTIGTNFAARGTRFTAAYSADMVRHFSTATGILQGARSPLQVTRDERLREVPFGGFEGATNNTMWDSAAVQLGFTGTIGSGAAFGAALAAGTTIFQLVDALPAANAALNGGAYVAGTVTETWQAVAARMLASLNSIVANATHGPNATILVVSSGLSISSLLNYWGQASRLPAAGLGNGAVNKLTYTKGVWNVVSVGDTSYTIAS
jgi:broad specificity phosphatase PhoE